MYLVGALINLVSGVLQLLTLLIVVRVILSWIPSVDYRHPLIGVIMRLTDPILQPIRRILPPVGGFDFSPLVAILLLQLISQLISQGLSQL
jgi:YggT family protein